VRAGARVQVAAAARRCLSDPALLFSLITTLPSTQSVFAVDPTTGPLGERLRQNVPTAISAPLLVAQGTDDEVIRIAITRKWVAERCAVGKKFEFRAYPNLTHMSLLASEALGAYLVNWTADRFAGRPA
jgi:alpha-beta hydrolase superfamily lysophospholipase